MLQVKFLTAIQEKDQRGLLENVNFTLGPGDKAVIIGEEGKQPVYEFCAGAVSREHFSGLPRPKMHRKSVLQALYALRKGAGRGARTRLNGMHRLFPKAGTDGTFCQKCDKGWRSLDQCGVQGAGRINDQRGRKLAQQGIHAFGIMVTSLLYF